MNDREECKLISEKGEVVGMGSRDLMIAILQRSDDGSYAIEGPGINMTYYRISGTIYPGGGTQDGKTMPVRSREDCLRFFGLGRK